MKKRRAMKNRMKWPLVFGVIGLSLFCFATAAESISESVSDKSEAQVEKPDEKGYLFCRYCGKVCSDFYARRAHEMVCEKNPHHK
jgi:hypothetical protein